MSTPTIEEVFKAYAQDAVQFAAERGVSLDYTEDSLARLDELLWDIAGDDPRKPTTPEEEERVWGHCKMFGAYVGEVVVRTLAGQWQADESPDGGVRPVVVVQGVQGFPLEKLWKRFTESPYDGVGGYCRVIRAILDRRTASQSDDSR